MQILHRKKCNKSNVINVICLSFAVLIEILVNRHFSLVASLYVIKFCVSSVVAEIHGVH